jgi:integrase
MMESGWARGTINAGMSRIRRIFKHAIANELIDASVLVKLQTLAPLLAGRTEAHDNPPRTAVPEQSLQRVRKEVSPLVRDLIDLQNLTGARSGELLSMTPVMIDTSGAVWTAELTDHKTLHHGQRRVLHFGPKAKKILRKHLKRNPEGQLFPITGAAYRRAITRACERLKIPRWVPHQLRHSAATKVRETFGLEHAQAVLGHSKASMSEHYAKVSTERAAEVAKRLG